MKRIAAFASACLLLGVVGCGGSLRRSDPTSTTSITSASMPLGGDDREVVSEEQTNDPDDLRITNEIRGALHDDDTLSPPARNAKVTTSGRHVTIRGTAANEAELRRIDQIARQHAVDVDVEVVVPSR